MDGGILHLDCNNKLKIVFLVIIKSFSICHINGCVIHLSGMICIWKQDISCLKTQTVGYPVIAKIVYDMNSGWK